MGSLTRRLKRRQDHNYKGKLLKKVATGEVQPPPGQVTHIDVLHDDWCEFLKDGVCNCDPEIRPRTLLH